MKRDPLTTILITAAILPSLHAGEQDLTPIPEERSDAPNSGDWEKKFTPYMWMAGMKGETGQGTLVAPVDVDYNRDFVFDAEMKGFVIGAQFSF